MNKNFIKQIIVMISVFVISFIIFFKIVNIRIGFFMGFFMTAIFVLSIIFKMFQNNQKIKNQLIILLILILGFFISKPSSPRQVMLSDTSSVAYNADLMELSPDINTEETTEITTSSNLKEQNSSIVYIGKTGTKYHRANCYTLKGKGTPISLNYALTNGKTPCKRCKP